MMYEPSASSWMRFLSGLTKIMFLSTSGSPELMSESASTPGERLVCKKRDDGRGNGDDSDASKAHRRDPGPRGAAAWLVGKVQDGETGHGNPDDREPYRVNRP